MIEHAGLLDAIDDLIVLTSTDRSNIGGYTGVDDDVLFNSVLVDGKTTKNEESFAIVQFLRYLA